MVPTQLTPFLGYGLLCLVCALLAARLAETEKKLEAMNVEFSHTIGSLSREIEQSRHRDRRRAQTEGDLLHQPMEIHSENAQIITRTVHRIVPPTSVSGGGHRRTQTACSPDNFNTRAAQVTAACCDEASEDCTGGYPHTCNEGCAAVLLPFWADCQLALGKAAAHFEGTVALCESVGGGTLSGTSAVQQLNLQCIDDSLSEAECIPECTETLHGYLLLLNIDGDDSKLTCELHNGFFSWVGAASDGGYIGSDSVCFGASVTSAAPGTFMLLVLVDAAVVATLTARQSQHVSIHGASTLQAAPAWGTGSFAAEVDGSLSIYFMQVEGDVVSHAGGLVSATASEFSGDFTAQGGTIQLRSCRIVDSATIVISGGGSFMLSSMSISTDLLTRALLHSTDQGSTLQVDHIIDPVYPQHDMTGTATFTRNEQPDINPPNLFEQSTPMWSVQSGPCEVFNLGRCVGRPHVRMAPCFSSFQTHA